MEPGVSPPAVAWRLPTMRVISCFGRREMSAGSEDPNASAP